VVHRIFTHPNAPSVRTFAGQRSWRAQRRRRQARLPGRHSWFVVAPTTVRISTPIQWLFTAVNALFAALDGLRIAIAASDAVVVSVADSGFSTIAGFVGAVVGRRPHVLLLFDPWEENAYPWPDRWVASVAEGRIMRRAAAVVVFSEELARHYRVKHGVSAHVLRIPITAPGAIGPKRSVPRHRSQVLSPGTVYWAQVDALERIARACERVADSELLVMGKGAEELSGATVVPPVPESAFRKRLAEADLLVLGLSFTSEHPLVIETATPARFPEILASGTPLLVHAPRNSYVARVTREAEAGIVVDEPDVEMLAEAIRRLLREPAVAAEMVQRARRLAAEFDIDDVVAELTEILNAAADH
jgi:glycosyltransferase involved in cell wall biosynthesis